MYESSQSATHPKNGPSARENRRPQWPFRGADRKTIWQALRVNNQLTRTSRHARECGASKRKLTALNFSLNGGVAVAAFNAISSISPMMFRSAAHAALICKNRPRQLPSIQPLRPQNESTVAVPVHQPNSSSALNKRFLLGRQAHRHYGRRYGEKGADSGLTAFGQAGQIPDNSGRAHSAPIDTGEL